MARLTAIAQEMNFVEGRLSNPHNVTKANMQTLKDTDGVEWITALKAPQIKKLARDGVLQLSLFDEQNLAEITGEDYPGERLIVCRNPLSRPSAPASARSS